MLWIGQKKAEPFLPAELKEEMRGITDGVKDAGVNVTMDQILLWNTNYDQWCIYCHPHYWHCDDKKNPGHSGSTQPSGGGCSSFCAWDEWAGGDGKLIFCKNEDNFNMPEQLDNRIMIIADPDYGFSHLFLTYPGMIGLEGCGIAIFTRLLLTHASTVDDAIKILSDLYDPYTQETRPKYSPSVSNNILCTICAMYPDITYHAKEPVEEFKAHVANM